MVAAHVVVGDVSAPVLSDEDLHHLRNVLRLRAGEPVSVTDGAGSSRSCTFTGSAALVPLAPASSVPRPGPPVTVAFAPVKGDRPEWAVQKLTEMGVDQIVLLSTRRGVVRWDPARAASHLARLQKVARAAVMQSRQCWLPSVEGMVDFWDLVGSSPSSCALAQPGGAPPSLARPTVLVGPEGGWDPGELSAGVPAVGLGPTVLRAETAAVMAGAVLCALRAGVVGPA